jgi:hypothetical protein
MFGLRLPETISFFVDKLLKPVPPLSPRSQERDSEPGIYVRVRLTMAIYTDEDGRRQDRWVHFLFSRPSNYTQVFMAVHDSGYPPLHKYVHKSYHDSCWRTDGFSGLNPLWQEMRDALDPDAFHGERPHASAYLDEIGRVDIEVDRPRGTRYQAKERWGVTALSTIQPL